MFDLYFDDLAPGMTFSTRARTVTEADVVAFAAQTGDFHPQHVDARWAAAGPFGERVAHGLLVLSYAAGLVPFDPDRVIALRRVRDATFKRPVRLGDTICVQGRIAATSEIDGGAGLVTVALTVAGEPGTVMRASVEVLWRRDAVPAPEPPSDVAPSGLVHAFYSVPL